MSETLRVLTPLKCDDSGALIGGDGWYVGQIYGETPYRQKRAAFVVRACNEHDGLIEELEYSELCMRAFIRDDNGYNLACLIKAHRKAEERLAAIYAGKTREADDA